MGGRWEVIKEARPVLSDAGDLTQIWGKGAYCNQKTGCVVDARAGAVKLAPASLQALILS
jgi:hypothetical protein